MASYRVMLEPDPTVFGQWYQFTWRPIGYLGGQLAVTALAPLFGLELSVKLLAILIVTLTTGGILWISREVHGAVQPAAIVALPLASAFPFQAGFINYTLSLALALVSFALWLRLARVGRLKLRAAIFIPISILLWAAHVFGWLIFGLLAFCAEIARHRAAGGGWVTNLYRSVIACLPLGLPFLAFFYWLPGEGEGSGAKLWDNLKLKPLWLITPLRDRWIEIDLASVGILYGVVAYSIFSKQTRLAGGMAAAAIGLFLCFLIIPFGRAYIDARIIPYAYLVALLAVSSQRMAMRKQAVLALAATAFFVARMLASTASGMITDRDWDRRLGALDHIAPGSRVAAFVNNRCGFEWPVRRTLHIPSMAVVRNAAFTNDQWDFGAAGTYDVVANGMGEFARDPSHSVNGETCPIKGEKTTSHALRLLPRESFDYVWLLRSEPMPEQATSGMTLLWSSGEDLLFKTDREGAEAGTRNASPVRKLGS